MDVAGCSGFGAAPAAAVAAAGREVPEPVCGEAASTRGLGATSTSAPAVRRTRGAGVAVRGRRLMTAWPRTHTEKAWPTCTTPTCSREGMADCECD